MELRGRSRQSLNSAAYGWVIRRCCDPKSTRTAMSLSASTLMARPRPYRSCETRSPTANRLRGASTRTLKGLVGRWRRTTDFVIPFSMQRKAQIDPARKPEFRQPPRWRASSPLPTRGRRPARAQGDAEAASVAPRPSSSTPTVGAGIRSPNYPAKATTSRFAQGECPALGAGLKHLRGKISHHCEARPAIVSLVAVVVPMNFVCAC